MSDRDCYRERYNEALSAICAALVLASAESPRLVDDWKVICRDIEVEREKIASLEGKVIHLRTELEHRQEHCKEHEQMIGESEQREARLLSRIEKALGHMGLAEKYWTDPTGRHFHFTQAFDALKINRDTDAQPSGETNPPMGGKATPS